MKPTDSQTKELNINRPSTNRRPVFYLDYPERTGAGRQDVGLLFSCPILSMSERTVSPNPEIVKNSMVMAIKDVRSGDIPVDGQQILAAFNADQYPELDEVLWASFGGDQSNGDRPLVKNASSATPLARVCIDASAHPPVLVQRSELDLGEAVVEVPGHIKYAGRMVVYSVLPLDEAEYRRVVD